MGRERSAVAQEAGSIATAEGALIAHRWLQGLDPHASERERLRLAGVPAYTIEQLYAEGFNALLPALARHYRTPGVTVLAAPDALPDAPALNAGMLFESLTSAQKRACHASFRDDGSSELLDLHAALTPHFAGQARAPRSRSVLITHLQCVWWGMAHHAELSPRSRLHVEQLACWSGRYLLNLPGFKHWLA